LKLSSSDVNPAFTICLFALITNIRGRVDFFKILQADKRHEGLHFGVVITVVLLPSGFQKEEDCFVVFDYFEYFTGDIKCAISNLKVNLLHN
jgi:hypothetical protein